MSDKTDSESEACPICFEMLYEAQVALPCRHVLCKLCCNQIKSMKMDSCPYYCRQSIEDWESNQDIATRVKLANPEGWLQKKNAETNQKLLKPNIPDRPSFLEMIVLYCLYADPANRAMTAMNLFVIIARIAMFCPNTFTVTLMVMLLWIVVYNTVLALCR